jgi:ankyrin repeat protein
MLAAWLVERGAEPQTRDDHGRSPLSIARRRGQSTLVELFEQASSPRPGAE